MSARWIEFAEELPLAGPIFRRIKYPLKRVCKYYLSPATRREWEIRIADVMACADNQFIPRVPRAGRLVNGAVVMHNGLKILPNSYYGEPMRLMLERNRGVHEPQEERIFQEALKYMPEGAVMLELGAYWGFYSMWFQQKVRNASCTLVEPHPESIELGRGNFSLNGMQGRFIRAFVGETEGRNGEGVRVACVDSLIAEVGIPRLHILHADIQGAEMDMLRGARNALARRIIDYIFVSTHTGELHRQCLRFLEDQGFTILAESDLDNTYSVDGLIVARRKELAGLEPIAIAQKQGQSKPKR